MWDIINKNEWIIANDQASGMRESEMASEEAAAALHKEVDHGDTLLEDISLALTDVSNLNLTINRITNAQNNNINL